MIVDIEQAKVGQRSNEWMDLIHVRPELRVRISILFRSECKYNDEGKNELASIVKLQYLAFLRIDCVESILWMICTWYNRYPFVCKWAIFSPSLKRNEWQSIKWWYDKYPFTHRLHHSKKKKSCKHWMIERKVEGERWKGIQVGGFIRKQRVLNWQNELKK